MNCAAAKAKKPAEPKNVQKESKAQPENAKTKENKSSENVKSKENKSSASENVKSKPTPKRAGRPPGKDSKKVCFDLSYYLI